MDRRCFDSNPISRRMVVAALFGAIGALVGIVLIVSDESIVAGIAMIAATGLVEAVWIVAAIVRLDCPECGRRLESREIGRLYACPWCEIEWEVPGAGR